MNDFDNLPSWLQRQIDAAFDKARTLFPDPVCIGLVPAAAKKCRPGKDEGELTNYHSDDEHFLSEGGGFLIDDDPGGFIPADGNPAESLGSQPDSLGLSMIPAALQYLDLPPDDEDVLSTFRNAAGGWGKAVQGEQAVSRRDWREVCAILVKSRAASKGDYDDTRNSSSRLESPFPDEDQDMDVLIESDPDDSEDEYHTEGDVDEPTSASSDDEYGGHSVGSARKGYLDRHRSNRRLKRQQSPSASETGTSLRLTSRQKKEAWQTFALFFPDVPSEQLEEQRIRIKDIARVANLLSIKLKTEEILEMLEAFSTSPDKSIDLSAFQSLVMTARLV